MDFLDRFGKRKKRKALAEKLGNVELIVSIDELKLAKELSAELSSVEKIFKRSFGRKDVHSTVVSGNFMEIARHLKHSINIVHNLHSHIYRLLLTSRSIRKSDKLSGNKNAQVDNNLEVRLNMLILKELESLANELDKVSEEMKYLSINIGTESGIFSKSLFDSKKSVRNRIKKGALNVSKIYSNLKTSYSDSEHLQKLINRLLIVEAHHKRQTKSVA
jgi:hypothetical protein